MTRLPIFATPKFRDEVFKFIEGQLKTQTYRVSISMAISAQFIVHPVTAHGMLGAYFAEIKKNERKLTKILKGNS